MKQLLSYFATFFSFWVTVSAQQDIKLHTEPDTFKKGYRIMAEKNKPASYTVQVTFQNLTGYTSSEGGDNFTATLTGIGTQQIASVTQIQNAPSYSFNYSYKSYLGKNLYKPDSLFTYLLPAMPGNKILITGVRSLGEFVGKGEADFYAIGFKYRIGDTICAARGGMVFETFDQAQPRSKTQIFNSSTFNRVRIEHNDGTLATYNIMSPLKLLVQVGDKVIPGQPLAVFSAEDFDYKMLFDVKYLNLKSTDRDGNHYPSIQTRFYLDDGHSDMLIPQLSYKAIHPYEIITKELSSREIKKLGLKSKGSQ